VVPNSAVSSNAHQGHKAGTASNGSIGHRLRPGSGTDWQSERESGAGWKEPSKASSSGLRLRWPLSRHKDATTW
jgi:hypothetical protein